MRVYEMFMGPLEADKPWDNKGIEGSRRFLDRVYRFFDEVKIIDDNDTSKDQIYHQTVKKVTEDYENLRFNTAISQMMIFMNECYKNAHIKREYLEGFVKLLNPLAPHLTEELWSRLGHDKTIAYEPWPTFDAAKAAVSMVTVVVQVNGKLRDKMEVNKGISKEELEKMALSNEKVKSYITGDIKKVIVVPDKLVSIVC